MSGRRVILTLTFTLGGGGGVTIPTYGCKISASRSNTAMLTCCQGLHGVDVLLRLCGPAGGDEAVAAAVLRPAGGVRGEGEPRGIYIYRECVAFFAFLLRKN